MAGSLPELKIGWHPVDPGPGPITRLIDTPPTGDRGSLAQAHSNWRRQVEQDQARIDAQHYEQPYWFGLPTPPNLNVVPIFGGTPRALDQMVATVALSGVEAGYGLIRVVNLLDWNVLTELKRAMVNARRTSGRFDVVSPMGSSVDLFAKLSADDLAGLAVDAMRVTSDRTGRRDAARDRQELLAIARHLHPPVSLEKMADAVDVALGGSPPGGLLSTSEVRALRDYGAQVVNQRRATADRLADLHADLRELASFSRSGQAKREVVGTGLEKLRVIEVRGGSSTDGIELARELLSRAMVGAFSVPGRGPELLVVVGAQHLADEVLDSLTGTAQRLGKQLVLAFTEVNEAAERTLGHAGSTFAVFLRLPNRNDAVVASEFLGKEFKFVINGISIAEGDTQEWNESYSNSSSSSRSTSTSSSRTSGYGGGGLNFGRSVGTTVTRGFESSQSTTHGSSRSRSSTTTRSAGRVQEYVVEPEVFQQLEDEMMFVVAGRTALLASCQASLRRSPVTSKKLLAIP